MKFSWAYLNFHPNRNMKKFNNLLRRIWQKLKYEQKTEWDKIAYSFLKNCGQILDIGCGEGRFIKQGPKKIIGIDRNIKSVEKCKQQDYNVIQSDVRSLPFSSQSINGIHCSHVIEHFSPGDVHKILSDFDRVLTPGGILAIRSPLLWNGFYSDLTHIRPYNPEAVIHYLTASNQRTLEQISVNYEIVFLKWRYKRLDLKNKYLNAILNILNRWGFPWLQKNGYMLIMKKHE